MPHSNIRLNTNQIIVFNYHFISSLFDLSLDNLKYWLHLTTVVKYDLFHQASRKMTNLPDWAQAVFSALCYCLLAPLHKTFPQMGILIKRAKQ